MGSAILFSLLLLIWPVGGYHWHSLMKLCCSPANSGLLASHLGVTFFDEQLRELCMNCLSDKGFEIRQAATDTATSILCGGEGLKLVHCIQVDFFASVKNVLHDYLFPKYVVFWYPKFISIKRTRWQLIGLWRQCAKGNWRTKSTQGKRNINMGICNCKEGQVGGVSRGKVIFVFLLAEMFISSKSLKMHGFSTEKALCVHMAFGHQFLLKILHE